MCVIPGVRRRTPSGYSHVSIILLSLCTIVAPKYGAAVLIVWFARRSADSWELRLPRPRSARVVPSAGIFALWHQRILMLTASAQVLTPHSKHTPTYPFFALSLDMLFSVHPLDHYVLYHHLKRDLYPHNQRACIWLASVPCEMSDVLANDKCRRRYRVSDLAVRTPN